MSLVRNQTRKKYSFKSSGAQTSLSKSEIEPIKNPPIGIKTPIRISQTEGLFEMHTDLSKQISDNLRNLLLTNHGERLGFFDFGANLRPILFNLGSEDGDLEAINRIKRAVAKYMPFVSLQDFQTFVDREDNKEVAKIGIQVTYSIPRVSPAIRSLEIMLYMGG
jgi:phage baseplate assembly protein W